MSQRRRSVSFPEVTTSISDDKVTIADKQKGSGHERSAYLWLALIILLVNGVWAVYHCQHEALPLPLNAVQAGKRGFSEILALAHVKYLAKLGPHPVGSEALDLAVKYVFAAAENIKQTAHWEVNVDVDLFHAHMGANRLKSGLFKGKTLIYSDLTHVVLRVLPKYQTKAAEHMILVSSHIDTVFSTGGAGDCSSCVGVMLELARGISQWAHEFKNGIIFLFNVGEEDGLNGAHSFITQHPWRSNIRFMVDLEAMGVGGKSNIFQSGSDPWGIETFAKAAKYPSGQIIAQDLFNSGAIKSSTDFQVYKEVAGLPGLDFAYLDHSAVYHTKNDKMELLKPGSLQHLGENMMAFLLEASTSPHFDKQSHSETDTSDAIFFDILGMHMVVYSQRFATMLYNSVILQSLLIWSASLFVGGLPSAIIFGLSCLSIMVMWIFSILFSIIIALILPLICTSPIPYIANPWLVVGLFGAPAILGAIFGQQIGFTIIHKKLLHTYSTRTNDLPLVVQENVSKWEAERWLFKGGFIQWLILLIAGNYYKVGSSYLAFVWLVSPAFAYGLMEATLSPRRLPRPLKTATLICGLTVPLIVSAGAIIQFVGTITGTLVRFDRHPGSTPEWLGNLLIAIFIAAVVCLTLVYILTYVHLSGAKWLMIITLSITMCLSLAAVSTGVIPAFTENVSRAVNVVHVVEAGTYGENQAPLSYISLFSTTPGKLTKEAERLKDEGFVCGRNKSIDFASFAVKYGCLSSRDTAYGWSESELPALEVQSDSVEGVRKTQVLVDMKISTRWSMVINTEEINDFAFEDTVTGEEIVPLDDKSSMDGWHIIQFAGGKNSPTKFRLILVWSTKNRTAKSSDILLKLRSDVNRVTPIVSRVLEKLPKWCSLFGEDGLGKNAHSLKKGCNCLGYIKYFDAHFTVSPTILVEWKLSKIVFVCMKKIMVYYGSINTGEPD